MKGSHSYGCPFCISNSFEGSIELGLIQPPREAPGEMLWPSSTEVMKIIRTYDGSCRQTQKTGLLHHACTQEIERNETMSHKKPGTATPSHTLRPSQSCTPLNSEQTLKHRKSFTIFLKNKEII